MDSDRFINWMKTSSTNDFYKLWGRVDQDLPAGKYKIQIDNRVNPKDSWEGKKNIVLSTASRFGGKKYLPGFFCLILGIVLFLVCIALVYLWIKPVKAHKEAPLMIDDGY